MSTSDTEESCDESTNRGGAKFRGSGNVRAATHAVITNECGWRGIYGVPVEVSGSRLVVLDMGG